MATEKEKSIIVGYAMKPDREKIFLKRNALPAQPIQGVCFRKIDLSAPLGPQLAQVDLVLHRMMDELQSVNWSLETREIQPEAALSEGLASRADSAYLDTQKGSSSGADERRGEILEGDEQQLPDAVGRSRAGQARGGEVGFGSGPSASRNLHSRVHPWETQRCFQMSAGHLELERYCAAHPDLLVVDAFDCVRVVMDRFAIHSAIEQITLPGLAVRVRAPKAIQVLDHDVAKLRKGMAELGMAFPCIMKPRVACGTPESHAMALLLKPEGLLESKVPLPASVQEYVDHGGLQHKVYVLGSKLFHTPRVSMPDAREVFEEHPGAAVVTFDSLRTPLSTSTRSTVGAGDATCASSQADGVDEGAVESIAGWLREKLGLSLFGFDVVVQVGTGDHVVVDVNYFPSFKDVPDEIAIPSFWEALRQKYEDRSAFRLPSF